MVASASDDCTVSVYDMNAKEVVYTDTTTHTDFVRSVAWDPSNSSAFKSAGWDGKVGSHLLE
jgi:WD40 repeat protein